MLRSIVLLLSCLAALTLSSAASLATEITQDNYEIYYGDINGDGRGDYYFHGKGQFILIHGDVITPIQIKPTPTSFIIYQGIDNYSAPATYSLNTSQLSAHLNANTLVKLQFGSDYYLWNDNTIGKTNILLRPYSSSSPTAILASYANTDLPSLIQVLPADPNANFSNRSLTISFSDLNSDTYKDITIGGYIYLSQSENSYLSYPTSAANMPFDFNSQAPSMFAYSLTTSGLPTIGSTSPVVATTQGNLSINNGAASYSIPLDLPPAVRNLKPKLSLNYNSRSGNGLMGVGWGLGGLSAITRCRTNFATEGVEAQKSNPRHTIGDRLCLDGQKLVVASSATATNDATYWASGQEYKTEIDSFTKIVAYSSSTNGGHGYFKAWTKDGRILTYGEQASSQNSKVYATNQPNGSINTWALDKVEDAYGNNYIITYDQNNANGEFYPAQIQLGATGLIIFSYINRNGQTPWGYDLGNKYQQTKVLEKVTTYVGTSTATPIKEYRVNYKLSQTTNRELVDTVTECGYDTSWKCARPLTFDWQVGEQGLNPTAQYLYQCNGSRITDLPNAFVDMDHDTYSDIIYKNRVYAWGTSTGCFNLSGIAEDTNIKLMHAITLSNKKAGIVVKQSGGFWQLSIANYAKNSTTVNYSLLAQVAVQAGIPSPLISIADINNDGREDIVGAWILLQNSSNGFVSNTGFDMGWCSNCIEQTYYDFNSDGIKDFTGVDLLKRYEIQPLEPNEKWFGSWFTYNKFNVMNGVDDKSTRQSSSIAYLQPSQYDTDVVRLSDSGTNFFRALGSQSTVYRLFADINGDGLKEFFYKDFSTTVPLRRPNQWLFRIGTGDSRGGQYAFGSQLNTGLLASTTLELNYIDLNEQISFSYDYDKDGNEDLILYPRNNGNAGFKVYLSRYINGQLNFVDVGVDPFTVGKFGAAYANGVFTGDVNNDGLVDAIIGPSNTRALLANQQQPDLVNKITNGFGAVTEIAYSPLTGDTNNGQPIYTPETTAPIFPQSPVNRAMQVVKKVSSSNGQSGFNHTYYNYQGGRQDIHRGFSGFKSIKITNATTGVSATSEYRLDWPYNGRISKQTVKDSSNKLISVVDNAYAIHSQNARFPYLDYSLQKSYELTTTDESTPISVSKTSNIFDTCGNITEQNTKIGKGFSGITVTGELSNQRVVNAYDYNGTTSDCSDDFLNTITQEISKASSADLKTIITEFTPNTQRDIETRTVFKNENIESTTTYGYESNGVVNNISEVAKDFDGTNEPARVTSFSNFAYGIYPQTITNAKGHQATLTYDYRFGTIKTETVLGQVTTNTYDVLGRQYAVKTPDSAVTLNTSFYCTSAPVTCPTGAYYGVATKTTHTSQAGKLGAPLTITFYDALQREIRSVSYSLDSKVINQATEYLASGYTHRVSEPYTTNGMAADTRSAFAWTVFSNYDSLGRANTITGADGGSKTTTYTTSTDGLVVTDSILVIKPNSSSETQTHSRTLNALGQVVKVEDALLNTVSYTYDSLGNLDGTRVNNNANTQISITHNLAGNKTFISDPDAGNINFAYNGFGELRKQTWQQGVAGIEKSITWDYDELGRQTSRLDRTANGSTTAYSWLWDTRQQGQLTSRTGNGFTEDYYYDGFSRLSRQIVTTSGLSGGEFIYTYDNFSRPETITYPNGFKIQRDYHADGYQTKTRDITNSASPKVLWALGNTVDTRGNFNNQLWGNGVVTQTGFETNSGRLSTIKSGRLSGANQITNLYGDIQNLSYTFDTLGNLYSRSTARTNNSGTTQENITDNFGYDKLNRLTHSTTSGLFGRTQTYQYDTGGLGNLVNRTDTLTGSSTNNDVGVLAYDRVRNAGIHAVTSAGGINYSYDKYGNMTARGSETITYDTFNKPTRIAGTTTTDFFYGPDHELYKQVSGSTTTYKLAGGIYEVTVNGTTTTQKSYVDGVVLNTRTLVSGTQTANDTRYLHADHLGSTEAITNALGQFVSRMSFSTWGERQKADWKPGPLTPTELNNYNAITTNGYTGHDQLDSHNLVHMDGRVYDPNLGRFLSADLYIQSPYNTQSFNRYSYVFNNPLSHIDPSGYCTKTVAGDRCPDDAGNLPIEEVIITGQQNHWSNRDLMQWMSAASFASDYYAAQERSGFLTALHNVQLYGPPLGVDGTVAAQYSACGSDANCVIETAATDAEMMALAVGGEVGVVAKVVLGASRVAKAEKALRVASVPGRVQSRINISNKGFKHVIDRHLNPAKSSNKSQFTLSQSEVRALLSDKKTVQSTARALENGNFARTITSDKTVGNLAGNMGGHSTNTFTVITNRTGELISAFPGGI